MFFQFKGVEGAQWDRNTSFDFAVEVTDTLSYYNVFLEVRSKENYPYRNLWLFVNQKAPEGSIQKDTINCELADIYGKWYGRGSTLHTLSLPFEQNIRFSISGTYLYSIKQGMRENKLNGISDIGLRIVKQGKQ